MKNTTIDIIRYFLSFVVLMIVITLISLGLWFVITFVVELFVEIPYEDVCFRFSDCP